MAQNPRLPSIAFATILEEAPDAMFLFDETGKFSFVNSRACSLLGYHEDELFALGVNGIFPLEGQANFAHQMRDLPAGKTIINEVYLPRKDSTLVLAEVSTKMVMNEYFLSIARELALERQIVHTVLDNLPDRIYMKDVHGRFIFKNRADARQMGATSTQEVIGKTDFDYYPPLIAAQYAADDQTVLNSGHALIDREERYITAEGTDGWMLTSKIPLRDAQQNIVGLVGIGHDISDRKYLDERLHRLNRTLAVLSAVNQAVVRIRKIPDLFQFVCQTVVEKGGFLMAWIGLINPEANQVMPVASAGLTGNYLENLNIDLNDDSRRHGPAGRAATTGRYVVSNDIQHDPHMTPWRDAALALGFRSTAAVPVLIENRIVGVLTVYSTDVDFFDDDEMHLFNELAGDISFAMEFASQFEQRQRGEMELRRQLAATDELSLLLQTTFDAFPANAVVLDTDGTIIKVNLGWTKFAEENKAGQPFLGSNYLTICDTASGLSAEMATIACQDIRDVIAGVKGSSYLEYPCLTSSEQRWFAMQVTPFPEPAPRRVVVAHIEITLRKRAEEELLHAHAHLEQRVMTKTAELETAKLRVESILNNNPNSILLLSPDLRIRQTNPAFNKMFASAPDDYLRQFLATLISGQDTEGKQRVENLKNTNARSYSFEFLACRKNGTLFEAALEAERIGNDGVVCTITDISTYKTQEQSLQQALKAEKELGDLKTRFIMTASHEFRTPLATILAATETLIAYSQKLTEEQITNRLLKIKTQVDHLRAVMDDVLLISRIQAKRVEFNPILANFNDFCQGIVEEFQERPDIQHSIQYAVYGTVEKTWLDPRLMRQVISNLVHNAVKYSPALSLVRVELIYSSDVVELRVTDQGIGILEHDLIHLFEPFHRGSNVGMISGTGLGLVITKEAVELHGGSIFVTSQSGTGTTISVRLPRRQELMPTSDRVG